MFTVLSRLLVAIYHNFSCKYLAVNSNIHIRIQMPEHKHYEITETKRAKGEDLPGLECSFVSLISS